MITCWTCIHFIEIGPRLTGIGHSGWCTLRGEYSAAESGCDWHKPAPIDIHPTDGKAQPANAAGGRSDSGASDHICPTPSESNCPISRAKSLGVTQQPEQIT
jgi:hypothetical protein